MNFYKPYVLMLVLFTVFVNTRAVAQPFFKEVDYIDSLAACSPAEIINPLIDSGELDINRTTSIFNLPLIHMVAMFNPHDDVLPMLVDKGADVNMLFNGVAPLHVITESRSPGVRASWLLRLGANVNQKNNDGNTPLHLAITEDRVRSLSLIDTLLVWGADVTIENNESESAFYLFENEGKLARLAGYNRIYEKMKDLYVKGINTQDDKKLSQREIDKLLRRYVSQIAGSHPKEWPKDSLSTFLEKELFKKTGLSPLHIVAADTKDPNIITEAIKCGYNVNACSEKYNTPLYVAATQNNNPLVIRALVDNGADLTNLEEYILAAAAENEREPVIEELLMISAQNDLYSDLLKWKMLDQAARHNISTRVVEYLVGLGADINYQDSDGQTVLHHVAQRIKNVNVIRVLIMLGANTEIRDKDGNTPYQLASDHLKTFPDIMDVLKTE